MTETETQALMKQILDSESPLAIELKLVYQLDIAAGSAGSRTVPLDELSKLPIEVLEEGTDRNTSLQQRANRPAAGLAFAFTIKTPNYQLLLSYSASASRNKMKPGIWRVHYLLLFHHQNNKSDTTDAKNLPDDPQPLPNADSVNEIDDLSDLSVQNSSVESPKDT
jgi:hypothetical protein